MRRALLLAALLACACSGGDESAPAEGPAPAPPVVSPPAAPVVDAAPVQKVQTLPPTADTRAADDPLAGRKAERSDPSQLEETPAAAVRIEAMTGEDEDGVVAMRDRDPGPELNAQLGGSTPAKREPVRLSIQVTAKPGEHESAIRTKIQSAYFPGLKKCAGQHGFTGSLTAAFAVDGRGHVTDLQVRGGSSELLACVRARLESWLFRLQGSGGTPGTPGVTLEMDFSPQ